MRIDQIMTAINNIRPNAVFTQNGSDYEGLQWLDENQSKPTQKEWQDAIDNLAAIEQAKRNAAEEKLAKLGLSVDDLKVLGLG